ncbi:Gp49 family protein [Comamonas sp.]|uniref:Gp49 family protein n=1 Tax=Comamonas sp. TaxID=34028 RepID=UPI0028AD53D2|nr:Gp49 family protein [Comamonas sp.]
MSQYRKKPIVIEAYQWHRNGDHPEDYSKDHEGLEGGELRVFTGAERQANGWEGDVVRYYRHPDVPGASLCEQCGNTHHAHGWIDTLEQGHRVCPGDWIIKGIKGEFYPCKPDIFEATYEKVGTAEQADNAVAVSYQQPSQREILEQSLVHGAASEVATVPTKAGAIAEGIKTLLDALHPAPVGQESMAKASTGPRVTPADVEAEIASEHYINAGDAVLFTNDGFKLEKDQEQALSSITICVLILKNGTKLAGINYGAIDPKQHSAEIGRQEARAQAVERVWELLGFRLRDKLAGSCA